MIALDTNLLIYAAQSIADARKTRAIDITVGAALGDSMLAVQALAEFTNACRRKGLLDLTKAAERVAEWADSFTIIAATPGDVLAANRGIGQYSLSFYDALMCATCRRGGATTLLSEDMQDGALIDGLRILNPFNPANDAAIAAALTASS